MKFPFTLTKFNPNNFNSHIYDVLCFFRTPRHAVCNRVGFSSIGVFFSGKMGARQSPHLASRHLSPGEASRTASQGAGRPKPPSITPQAKRTQLKRIHSRCEYVNRSYMHGSRALPAPFLLFFHCTSCTQITVLFSLITQSNLKFELFPPIAFHLSSSSEAEHSFKPFTAQRCRSETEKNIFEDLFSLVLSQLNKNITPLETLTFII